MSGYATLDGVRATLNAADLYDLPEDPYYAVWGYSGGALASEWAAELQVDYAPELDFAGAALGGLTPNVTSVLVTINGKLSAGLAPVRSCPDFFFLFSFFSFSLGFSLLFYCPLSPPIVAS
jgi:hypothetical protein